jgi:hypothetical protein
MEMGTFLPRAAAVLASLVAAGAHAQVHVVAPSLESFEPTSVVQAPDGSFWATERFGYQPLVHYAPDGRVIGATFGRVGELLAASAGTVVSGEAFTCYLYGFDATPAPRWQYDPRGTECVAVAPDAAGNAWLLSRTPPLGRYLARLDRHGVVRVDASQAPLRFESIGAIAGDPRRDGVIVAGRRDDAAAIVAFDTALAVRWSWIGAGRGEITHLSVAGDGSISAVGIANESSGTSSRLSVTLGPDGTLRRYVDGLPMPDVVTAQAGTADGANWILANAAAGVPIVTRVAPDGEWTSQPLPLASRCTSDTPCRMLAATADSVWIAVGSPGAAGTPPRLQRVRADFTRVDAYAGDDRGYRLSAVLADGTALATVQRADYSHALEATALDGTPRTPPVTRGLFNPVIGLGGATFDAAGDALVASVPGGTERLRSSALDRIDVAGRRTWRAAEEQGWVGAGPPVTGPDRTCLVVVYPTTAQFTGTEPVGHQVECFAHDGRFLFSSPVPLGAGGRFIDTHVRPLADGHVVLVYRGIGDDPSPRIAELDGAGRLVRHVRVPLQPRRIEPVAAAIAADGSAFVAQGPNSIRVARDGTALVEAATNTTFRHPEQALPLAGGGWFVAGAVESRGNASVPAVGVYDADARLLWSRQVESSGSARAVVSGDSAWVHTGVPAATATSSIARPLRVQRFSAGGTLLWDRPASTLAAGSTATLALSPDSRELVVAYGEPGRVRLLVVDAATGAARRERFVVHAGTRANVAAAWIDADGSMRVAYAAAHAVGGDYVVRSTLAVATLPRGADGAPTVALDQRGTSGTWYPAYAAGQGLVFDWIAGSRTLFAPWFTYSRNSRSDPAQHRWFSLQGDVAPGATQAELGIFENTGGSFDAQPATTARRVGTATMTLLSCDEATLDYRFDEGVASPGGTGSIAITRLTAPAVPCRRSDGSERPAAAPPSLRGFEARHGGAWFAPATAGQGVMFDVVPGQSLFGAWFTYDAGTPDDATAQSWSTLQAGLADADAGRVVATLYRTIGGTFDAPAPVATSTWAVGTATITFLACDRARLEYRFDDVEAAAPQRGRTGTIALERLGGCAEI